MELMTKKQVKKMVKVFMSYLDLPSVKKYKKVGKRIMKEVMTDYKHTKAIVNRSIKNGTIDELSKEMFMFAIESSDINGDIKLHIYYDKNDMRIFRNGECIILNDAEEENVPKNHNDAVDIYVVADEIISKLVGDDESYQKLKESIVIYFSKYNNCLKNNTVGICEDGVVSDTIRVTGDDNIGRFEFTLNFETLEYTFEREEPTTVPGETNDDYGSKSEPELLAILVKKIKEFPGGLDGDADFLLDIKTGITDEINSRIDTLSNEDLIVFLDTSAGN